MAGLHLVSPWKLSAAVSEAALEESTDTETSILARYTGATELQAKTLRGAQMEVDIDARLVKLQKQGRMRALRAISQLGQITYRALGFSGDNTVKQEVIARYLAAEAEGRADGSVTINSKNYKFKLKGQMDWYGRRVDIVQLTPRRKTVGLFKGELWVDSETGMPVREAGEFVKTPSVFLKKVAFVRDYELLDGVSIPKHIESTVDTRIVGRAELQINFSHVTLEPEAADQMIPVANASQTVLQPLAPGIDHGQTVSAPGLAGQ